MTTPTTLDTSIAPGTPTRGTSAPTIICAHDIDPSNPPTAYGQAVAAEPANGWAIPIRPPCIAGEILGVLVRSAADVAALAPPTSGRLDVMYAGYVAVQVGGSTAPFDGCPAYVRTGAQSQGKPLGGIEAAADGANTLQLRGAYFTGPSNSNGVAELALNV